MGLNDRLQHAWTAFMNKDPTYLSQNRGQSSSYRPDRIRLSRGNEKSIITSIYNRIALDAAAIKVEHVQLDDEDRYIETIKSCLNNCLTVEANIDQTGRAMMQDAVMSLLDEGCVAIVPTITDIDPIMTDSYKICEMRVGKVTEWMPTHVRVRLYNDATGRQQEVTLPKKMVAIVENPLYAVMNEPNSTMQRLIRKLNLLDVIDEQSGSGKLDLLIQLPYIIKTPARRQQAEERRKDIENQLKGPYGIAYTDGTEKITQLNRPIENNLMKQIEYLTSMLYSQLGLTLSVMDGSADDVTMNNYYTRTIEPILSAIVDEMRRKFLTKTARTQNKSVRFFRDPFKLVPVTSLPDIADKFTRNEIVTSNEMRQIIGMKPSADPNADQLRNKNLNQNNAAIPPGTNPTAPQTETPVEDPPMTEQEYMDSMAELDGFDSELDDLDSELNDELKHYASEYYDPVKAHEYYERTKQLKARKSTAKLNEAGKAAADYVKDSLTTKRKGLVEAENQSMKSKLESHRSQTKAEIASIRERLKGMSKEDKLKNRESLQAEIDGLRENNRSVREQLRAEFKKTKTNLKDEYDNKYMDELDKIKSTKEFVKSSGKGKSKKGKIMYLK